MTDQVMLADTMRVHIQEYQSQLVNSEKHAERCLGAIQALENLFKALQEREADVDQSDGGESQAEAKEDSAPATAAVK